jgi:hypothetical protein
MKKLISGLAIAAAIAAVPLSASAATGDPHDGTPNSANACHGQFVAYFASHGIATPGQAAKWFSEYTGQKVSAGDLNKVVADICDMVHEVPG